MTELPATWSELASHLLPLIRRPFDPAATRALPVTHALSLAQQPVAPSLRALLVVDGQHSRHFLQNHHLDSYGVSLSLALAAARENLAAAPAPGLTHRSPLLWQLASSDGYEPSRALLPGWLRAFREQEQGPFLLLPDSHTLLVSPTTAGLPELLAAGQAARQAGRTPLCAGILTLGAQEQLQPYVHAGLPASAYAWRDFHAEVSADQSDWLLEHGPEDTAVPSLALWRGPDGAGRLVASWHEGLPAWLPDAELIHLAPSDGPALVLPAAALAAWLSPVPELSPTRYEATVFPTAAERALLAPRAVSVPGLSP